MADGNRRFILHRRSDFIICSRKVDRSRITAECKHQEKMQKTERSAVDPPTRSASPVRSQDAGPRPEPCPAPGAPSRPHRTRLGHAPPRAPASAQSGSCVGEPTHLWLSLPLAGCSASPNVPYGRGCTSHAAEAPPCSARACGCSGPCFLSQRSSAADAPAGSCHSGTLKTFRMFRFRSRFDTGTRCQPFRRPVNIHPSGFRGIPMPVHSHGRIRHLGLPLR